MLNKSKNKKIKSKLFKKRCKLKYTRNSCKITFSIPPSLVWVTYNGRINFVRLCKKRKEEDVSDDVELDYYSNGGQLTSGVTYRASNITLWSNDFLSLKWYIDGSRDYCTAYNQLNDSEATYWWMAFC